MPSIRSISAVAPVNASASRVVFGAAAAAIRTQAGFSTLSISLPLLAGSDCEYLLDPGSTEPSFSQDGCTLFRGKGRLAGFVVASAAADQETAARDLYRRVFAATSDLRLYRIWNYVPHINAVADGVENYGRFCRGRSHAFEEHFGQAFRRQLPAASAVGVARGPLAVAFLAGDRAPEHFENPRQVPAFEYPPAYGPRPPSFSRATLVTTATGHELFVSGTAAIRGHATIAPNDLAGQLACTCENLNLIAATVGAGADFGADEGWGRTFKVYIRHAGDFAQVQADLEKNLLRTNDDVTYLQADLCRADLLVEIEAVLTKA